MSPLASKLYSWYNACIVDSHQLRNLANGRCLPRACISLGDILSLRSSKHGDFAANIWTLDLSVTQRRHLAQLCLKSVPSPLAYTSLCPQELFCCRKEGIKDELKGGSLEVNLMWQHVCPLCLHISTCFVGVLPFGLALGVEELPATCMSLHPSGFPGQKQQLPTHKKDAQAPPAVWQKDKGISQGRQKRDCNSPFALRGSWAFSLGAQ